MTICINKQGDRFEQLLELAEEQVDPDRLEFPLTHALVTARSDKGCLLLFNSWRKQWEVAGGIREQGESLRDCVLRELLEETNQVPDRLQFRGLMKVALANGRTEYGGLFSAWIGQERQFKENEEAAQIVFWDGTYDIGYINEIDRELLNYYRMEPEQGAADVYNQRRNL
jgi:8-oxo-dGTP diphosphatase